MSITLTALATLAGYAGHITGVVQKERIKTKDDADKIADALRRSEIFNNYVKLGYPVIEIIEKMDIRHARGKEFEDKTGVPWPL